MRSLRAAAALPLLAGCAALSGCGSGPGPSRARTVAAIPAGAWPQHRRDLAGCSYAADGLRAADAGALQEHWRTRAGKSTCAQAVVADGAAYLTAAVVGSVTALDAATGAVRWSRTLDAPTTAACEGAPQHPGMCATFADGVLFVAGGRTPEGDAGAVLALDAATGRVAWRHATPGAVLQPVAASDETVVAVTAFTDPGGLWDGTGHGVLEILDARTGALLATAESAAASLSAASFGAGALLWPTLDGEVRALSR